METVIVAAICIALLLLGGLTLSQGFLSSVDTTTAGMEAIGDRDGDTIRTQISMLAATWQPLDNTLDVSLSNSGQVKLANFGRWDVIVQYFTNSTLQVRYLTYTSGALGNNQWVKEGIYEDAAASDPEVFDPGILNPGEDLVIQAKLDPGVDQDTTNLVVISTPNGIPTSMSFAGPPP